MDDVDKKKEIKYLILFLAFFAVLLPIVSNIGLYYISDTAKTMFDTKYIITEIITISVNAYILIGLWSFKKWAFIFESILLVVKMISFLILYDFVGVVIIGIIFYYLYRNRDVFI